MSTDWSKDPTLAVAQRRRERGPRIPAYADTPGLPPTPEDMTDVDCTQADLGPDPIVAVQRQRIDRGTQYSIAAHQYEPRGDGTARRLTAAEVVDLARIECHDWIASEFGVHPSTQPELAARLEPRDLGRGRVGVVVDEVLRAALTRP